MTAMDGPRQVNPDRLRELGFGENLISEAAARAARGVLGIEPPAELLDRLLERAKRLTPEKSEEENAIAAEWNTPIWAFAKSRAAGVALANTLARCAAMGTMPGRYAESLEYAVLQHERPLVMVENHNLINPIWWRDDRVFRQIRSACRMVNRTVSNLGVEPSARVVVLKPSLAAYLSGEIEQLDLMLKDSTSDLYWISKSRAGQYAAKDVTVIGDKCVFEVKTHVHSSSEALGLMISSEVETGVQRQRQDILKMIGSAEPVKLAGELKPDFAKAISSGGVSAAIEMVLCR